MEQKITIPPSITCTYDGKVFIAKKDSNEVRRVLPLTRITFNIQDSEIVFSTKEGNKNDWKRIRSAVAHIGNLFKGLDKPFVYTLEACNVHFPMTLKVDSTNLIINNFLGERVARTAYILPGVIVEAKGAKITVSSPDLEAAGQTAANIERATKVKKRDRRVFQDGIFIVSKPGDIS